MKCDRCGAEISAQESHSYKGQTLCDDCYIDAVSVEKECDPWATYVSGREKMGPGFSVVDVLDETQKKINEFVKRKGRATRKEIMAEFGLSADDLDPHLRVLMHAEMIKERSEGGVMYLIPVPVSR